MKSIVILGAPCVGKSTMLRELYNIPKMPFRYGIAAALKEPKKLGDYYYLPEINSGQNKNPVMLDFIKDNLVITDVSIAQPLGLYIMKDVDIIVLTATDDELIRNIKNRPLSKASKKTFEERLTTCIKWRDKLKNPKYSTMGYEELKDHLKFKLNL